MINISIFESISPPCQKPLRISSLARKEFLCSWILFYSPPCCLLLGAPGRVDRGPRFGPPRLCSALPALPPPAAAALSPPLRCFGLHGSASVFTLTTLKMYFKFTLFRICGDLTKQQIIKGVIFLANVTSKIKTFTRFNKLIILYFV